MFRTGISRVLFALSVTFALEACYTDPTSSTGSPPQRSPCSPISVEENNVVAGRESTTCPAPLLSLDTSR